MLGWKNGGRRPGPFSHVIRAAGVIKRHHKVGVTCSSMAYSIHDDVTKVMCFLCITCENGPGLPPPFLPSPSVFAMLNIDEVYMQYINLPLP